MRLTHVMSQDEVTHVRTVPGRVTHVRTVPGRVTHVMCREEGSTHVRTVRREGYPR